MTTIIRVVKITDTNLMFEKKRKKKLFIFITSKKSIQTRNVELVEHAFNTLGSCLSCVNMETVHYNKCLQLIVPCIILFLVYFWFLLLQFIFNVLNVIT